MWPDRSDSAEVLEELQKWLNYNSTPSPGSFTAEATSRLAAFEPVVFKLLLHFEGDQKRRPGLKKKFKQFLANQTAKLLDFEFRVQKEQAKALELNWQFFAAAFVLLADLFFWISRQKSELLKIFAGFQINWQWLLVSLWQLAHVEQGRPVCQRLARLEWTLINLFFWTDQQKAMAVTRRRVAALAAAVATSRFGSEFPLEPVEALVERSGVGVWVTWDQLWLCFSWKGFAVKEPAEQGSLYWLKGEGDDWRLAEDWEGFVERTREFF